MMAFNNFVYPQAQQMPQSPPHTRFFPPPQGVEQIKEELEGAKEYTEDVIKYKIDYPKISELYYTLANIELDHVNELHTKVVTLIKEQTTEPPEFMKEIWAEEHEKIIDCVARIKVKLQLYKNQ